MKSIFERLYQDSFVSFKEELIKKIEQNQKTFIITANPETFMVASKEKAFQKMMLDKNIIIVPDGIGVVKGANMLGYKVAERITGIDIAWTLLEEGNKRKKSIYLLGATEEVKEKMIQRLKKDYPNLLLLGATNGYVEDKDGVFSEIKKLKPDIVMVALGIPAQEKLIYKHLSEFKKGIFIGVGGSFDVISGVKKRAPKFFQKFGLEWFYRLIKEPKRMKRFYNSNVKFIFEVRKLSRKR